MITLRTFTGIFNADKHLHPLPAVLKKQAYTRHQWTAKLSTDAKRPSKAGTTGPALAPGADACTARNTGRTTTAAPGDRVPRGGPPALNAGKVHSDLSKAKTGDGAGAGQGAAASRGERVGLIR